MRYITLFFFLSSIALAEDDFITLEEIPGVYQKHVLHDVPKKSKKSYTTKSYTTPAVEEEPKGLTIHDKRVFWGSVFIALVLFIYPLVMGFRDEAIYYYDYWDLAITYFPVLAGVLTWLFEPPVDIQNTIIDCLIYSAIAYNFLRGLAHNRFFLGLTVGFSRIILSYAIPALIIYSLICGPQKKEGESEVSYQLRVATNWVSKIFLLLGVAWVIDKLVNGERVRYRY